MFFLPAIAGQEDQKILIRMNTLFQFPGPGVVNDGDAPAFITASEGAIQDYLRVATLRMWYGYGWSSNSPSPPTADDTMLGYFPVTYAAAELSIDPANIIAESLNEFYANFSAISSIDYFNLAPKPMPKIYTYSDEGGGATPFEERPLLPTAVEPSEPSDLTDCALSLTGPAGPVMLKNWKQCLVRLKKFPVAGLLGGEDFDFIEFYNNELGPALGKTEAFIDELGNSIEVPKRYYDIVFQIDLANDSFYLDSRYNQYHEVYEEAIKDTSLIIEPTLPNIFLIDFTTLGITEYLDVISLHPSYLGASLLAGFPSSESEITSLLDNFKYSNNSEYIQMWTDGFKITFTGALSVLTGLADQYRKLIFSNLFKEEYNTIQGYYKSAAPMWVNAILPNLNFGELSNIFSEHAIGLGLGIPYDPMTHLISDTQLSQPKPDGFWEITSASNKCIAPSLISTKEESVESFGATAEPFVIGERADFTFEVNNTWNIEDWFHLYCVPERPSDDCIESEILDIFAADPSGTPGITSEDIALALSSDFDSWGPWPWEPLYKPVPVGGYPASTVPGVDSEGSPIEIPFMPAGILPVPNSDEWGYWESCDESSWLFKSALEGLYADYSELVSNNFRTFQQTLDGNCAYSERLFYRLEKKDEATGDVIQNAFFPSSLEAHEYLDAQVHYNKLYEYTLYGYYFVVGTEYWYSDSGEPQFECPPGYILSGDECVLAPIVDPIEAGEHVESKTDLSYCELAQQRQYYYDVIQSALTTTGAIRNPFLDYFSPDLFGAYDGDANGTPVPIAPSSGGEFLQFWEAMGKPYIQVSTTGAGVEPPYAEGEYEWVPLIVHPEFFGYFTGILFGPTSAAEEFGEGTVGDLQNFAWDFYTWGNAAQYRNDDPEVEGESPLLKDFHERLGFWVEGESKILKWDTVVVGESGAGSPAFGSGFGHANTVLQNLIAFAWDIFGNPAGDELPFATAEPGGEFSEEGWYVYWDPAFPEEFAEGYYGERGWIQGKWAEILWTDDAAGNWDALPASMTTTIGIVYPQVLYPRYGGIDPEKCCDIGKNPGGLPEGDLWKWNDSCVDPPPGEEVNIIPTPTSTEEITVTAQLRPYPVLVETKVAPSITEKVVDLPPVYPEVDIIPYRSVKDKALLMINGNVGKYQDYPIVIEQGDISSIASTIIEQDITMETTLENIGNVGDHLITFDGDDYPTAFEIFRIDFAPTNYQDFSLGRKLTLDNTVKDRVVVTANSIVDSILPNKKYWYTFRSIDIHNHMSNPSGIFQLEMVDTGNSIFPLIEMYPLPEPSSTYVKPMKKYLKIAPSAIQETLDVVTTAQDFVDNPSLGFDAEETMWGKKYKLRITSKSTGKKVDINFSFKQGDIDDTEL